MFQPFFLKNLALNDINPRICGIHICNSSSVYPWHYIDRHVLHYVTKGQGKYLVDNQEYSVGEGDIFISHAGQLTSYVADAEDPFTYIWVSFECADSFSALLNRDIIHAPWAGPIFSRIIDANETAAPEWAICAQLYTFFVQLAQRQSQNSAHKEDYVSRAINYMQANYADSISIDQMAAALGLNRSYFSRLFHQQTGQSPQSYLVSCRLEKAAELLTTQGLSQKEAALQVGYPDVYAFSRMFKRKYGISPGTYVHKYRQVLPDTLVHLPLPDSPSE